MPKTLFISDLHLGPNQPELNHLFFHFLEQWAPHAEALYILGDLFEMWIGDDDATAFTQQVQAGLYQLTNRGVKVYFMPGNRDFLLGKKFLAKTGGQLLADPTQIELYGIPTLLSHGDKLCTRDKLYQYFRCVTRFSLTQRLFLTLPLTQRRQIANYLRNRSKMNDSKYNAHHIHASESENDKFDVDLKEIFTYLEKYTAQRLIHGHTHRPAIQLLNKQYKNSTHSLPPHPNQPVSPASLSFQKRFVLSDWQADRGNVLVITPEDSKLVYFSSRIIL